MERLPSEWPPLRSTGAPATAPAAAPATPAVSEPAPIRVVIVDDNPMIQEMLNLTLTLAGMEVVGTAGDGSTGLRLVAELQPDLLVLDVLLPDISGVAVAREVRATWGEVKILALTGHDDEPAGAALRALLELGVQGYLRKTTPVQEIAKAAQKVAAGERVLDPEATRDVLLGLVTPLTPREQEVLQLVAAGKRNAGIADCLNITPATVECHIGAIHKKLRATSRVDLVNQARLRGLV